MRAGPLLICPFPPDLAIALKEGSLLPTTPASGHRRRHATPEPKKLRCTSASRLYSTMLQITDVPYPECEGSMTGGPPLSRQSMVNRPPDADPSLTSQESSTRPV